MADFVKLPELPVMVTVAVPVVALPLAVKVKVLAPVVLAGLKDAVTPLGIPEADKLTLPLKPFCGVTVTVAVPLAPCVIARLLGDAESVNVGGGLIVSEIVVVPVKLADVPVIVTAAVPVAAVLLDVSVTVLVPVVLVGLNEADTPLGRPDADTMTLALNPL